jgi:hypothetical protein
MEHAAPAEDYSARYWRYLLELTRRQFKLAERRVLEKLLALTYGRELIYGQPASPAVFIARLDDLADSISTLRGNMHPILENLVNNGVLSTRPLPNRGRGTDPRSATWWYNQIDLWQVECWNQADPGSAQRVAAAESSILSDTRQLSDQRLLFPDETSDAEVQAEAARESAANLPPPGLSSSGVSRSEIQNQPVLKFRTGSEFQNEHTTIDRGRSRASEPGNQVLIKPGNLVGRGTGEGKVRLDQASWDLLNEFEDWCGAGTPKQRLHWGWRIWKNRNLFERAFREVQLTVQLGEHVRSRAGLVKRLWVEWGGDGPDRRHADPVLSGQLPAHVPTAAAAVAAAAPELSWEEKQALMRRCKQEFARQFQSPAGPEVELRPGAQNATKETP